MRIFILILVLLNAGYLAWNRFNPVPVAKPLPAVSAGVPELQLLSERRPLQTPPSAEQPTESASSASGSGTKPQPQTQAAVACYTIGPFTDKQPADAVIRKIRQAGFKPQLRTTTQQATVGYWVYLPPQESRKAALKVAQGLAHKGIKDYFIVTTDEDKNAISLGLFSEPARAKRRQAYLKKLGYATKIRVRTREQTLYWLDYDERDGHHLDADTWQAVGTEGTSVQRISRDCR
ncbi:MAG: SPOR domain-containing protein [Gammaproteobacteria bacterium]|jgi:hypothetical protein